MQGYTNTYKAMFPQPVEIPAIGITLAPITLAHLAAIEAMGADVWANPLLLDSAVLAAWLLSQKSADETRALFSEPSAVKKARGAAFDWASGFDIGATGKIRLGVIDAMNAAFDAAVPQSPPAEGAAEATSDGPSN